ncbi:MAG: pseudouridine synthase [Chitinophagales bacterium]
MKKKKSAKYRSKSKKFKRTSKTTKDNVKTYSPQTQSKHIKTPTNIFNNSDAREIENTGMRLNKYIAHSGICSRRKADEIIKAGDVTVDGEVIKEMGYRVQANQIVKCKGKTVSPEKKVYVLLNKPRNFITTTKDDKDRRTVMSLIANASNERLYPVGRLDRNTTGLLLFTNDGELTQKLAHPSYEINKMYHVVLDKEVRKHHIEAIRKGLTLEDGKALVDEINYVADVADKREVGIQIHIGRNRIVRRIFEHLDYEVKRLDRVLYAGLTKKNLPRGRWRYLSAKEVLQLRHLPKYNPRKKV